MTTTTTTTTRTTRTSEVENNPSTAAPLAPTAAPFIAPLAAPETITNKNKNKNKDENENESEDKDRLAYKAAEKDNDIYRGQVKYYQDHLNRLRGIVQDKENIIENLMLRYDLGILLQDSSQNDFVLPSTQKITIQKAENTVQRTILENFELREMVNELRDECFRLRNGIYDLQDRLNAQTLRINRKKMEMEMKTLTGDKKENDTNENKKEEKDQESEVVNKSKKNPHASRRESSGEVGGLFEYMSDSEDDNQKKDLGVEEQYPITSTTTTLNEDQESIAKE